MTDDKAWLPTHLQQAEKVLDKPAPAPKKHPVRDAIRKVVPGKSKGLPAPPYNRMRGSDEKMVRSLKEGCKYRLNVHNSLSGQVTKLVATYKGLDEHGTLWFRSESGQQRYFRPSAVMSVKEVKE